MAMIPVGCDVMWHSTSDESYCCRCGSTTTQNLLEVIFMSSTHEDITFCEGEGMDFYSIIPINGKVMRNIPILFIDVGEECLETIFF